MRIRQTVAITTFLLALVAAIPPLSFPELHAQEKAGSDYQIEMLDKVRPSAEYKGKNGLWVTVQFRVKPLTAAASKWNPNRRIKIYEDDKPVADLAMRQPGSGELTAVLCVDISGSMAKEDRIGQLQRAAEIFLGKMPPRSDIGLVLFDHEIVERIPPVGNLDDLGKLKVQRDRVERAIKSAKPRGGTAYLDATVHAIDMLKDATGTRAVVVMTDGIDLNSKTNLDGAIAKAKAAGIPVYTIGVGEPGTKEQVSTVLVLDRSGSMLQKAAAGDQKRKIDALHESASRFIDIMRPGADTAILPFSSKVEACSPFFSHTDKEQLKERIRSLKAEGGTMLYDATYAGIGVLAAINSQGKRALVVMTDGVDEQPGSRHRLEEIVEFAKQEKVPLHLLALGQDHEINEKVMKQMAAETGGTFNHARNEKMLFEIFEKIAIGIYDEGIDVAALTKLATDTKGQYYHARDANKLSLTFGEVAAALDENYTHTFESPRVHKDGTSRGVDIRVGRVEKTASGEEKFITEGASEKVGYQVHGVVPPGVDWRWYLGLLVVLGALLAVPPSFRRISRLGSAR